RKGDCLIGLYRRRPVGFPSSSPRELSSPPFGRLCLGISPLITAQPFGKPAPASIFLRSWGARLSSSSPRLPTAVPRSLNSISTLPRLRPVASCSRPSGKIQLLKLRSSSARKSFPQPLPACLYCPRIAGETRRQINEPTPSCTVSSPATPLVLQTS